MRIRSLSLKVALLVGAALTAVFAMDDAPGAAGRRRMEAQTRQLQSETPRESRRRFRPTCCAASGRPKGRHGTAGLPALGSRIAQYTTRRSGSSSSTIQGCSALVGLGAQSTRQSDAAAVNKPGHDASGRYSPYWNRGSGTGVLEASRTTSRPASSTDPTPRPGWARLPAKRWRSRRRRKPCSPILLAPAPRSRCAFFAKPVFNAQGRKIGALAFQLPASRLWRR